jgi:hypothetical protein
MYVAPLNKNLILQTDDSHDDLSQELTNDDLFASDEDEIKLDNPESRSSLWCTVWIKSAKIPKFNFFEILNFRNFLIRRIS